MMIKLIINLNNYKTNKTNINIKRKNLNDYILSEIDTYLRSGYQLFISTSNNECRGIITLKVTDTYFRSYATIKIESLFHKNSYLKEYLTNNFEQFIKIHYDFTTKTFIGEIVEELRKKPFCQFYGYGVVGNSSVKSSDFYTCFQNIEKLITTKTTFKKRIRKK